jgi:CelD/BcsL family acetyltransferase involved in cellulose biosynthesis
MLAYQGQTVSICLTCSAEERWRHYKRQLRQHIAHGRERGFETVIDAQWRYAEDFFAIYASTMRRNRAPEFFYFSREYFARLRQELGEHAVLAVTRRGSEVASAGLIFDYQGLAHVHLAGTREDFLPQSPSKVMFADVAEWGASRGVRLLHLGGGRGGSDSDSLFRFKSEFSPLRHRFHTVRLVLDDGAYEALTAAHLTEVGMRRIDQTYFPQYRAPLAPEALNLP